MIFSPSRMGRLNKHALLRQLQKAGTASRADLARSLGMSQPTAGKIVDELIAQGVVEETEVPGDGDGNNAPRLGRPGRMLQLNLSQPKFLGLQLGLEETRLAELPLGGMDEDKWQVTFSVKRNHREPAAEWERQLAAAAPKIKARQFLGILLSVPGIVDSHTGRVLYSPNIHWSEQADLPTAIRRLWKAPVLLVQEELALAFGQLTACPEYEDFLLVDFGEGIGGAVMVQGKPLANPLPISGELGHTPVPGNRRACGCGATGCLETLVSIHGLLESFREAHPRKTADWPTLRAHLADKGLEAWLTESLEAAAAVIAGALNVLGLRHVILTGSVNDLPPAVLAHLTTAIQRGTLWARFGEVVCLGAPRRRTAGLAALGLDQFLVPDDGRRPAGKIPFSRGHQRAET